MSTQSETVTVRLSPDTKSRLEQLANETRRTKSFLAAEAISDFVDRELAIVAGIKRGLADIEAGRVVPHEQVVRRIQETIDRVANSKK